jgi:capsular polysaccharide biosynthesis protein
MGIGIAVGVDILKNLIRDESDITSAVGLPVLSRLPKI